MRAAEHSGRPHARGARPAASPLSAKAEVRLNGSVVMINGLSGALGDGAFNGWASVDIASKPLVKLDLDFQRLEIALRGGDRRRPAASQPWSNAPIDLTGLNYVDAQARISAAEIDCRRRAFRAGRDRRDAGRRRIVKLGVANLGAYGGQANGELDHRRLGGQPRLRAAQRPRRRARAAAAAAAPPISTSSTASCRRN